MSQKLYEEALADAKKVAEVAENNAKQAVLEAVVPRIKQLIESQLLNEDAVTDDDELLTDEPGIDAVGTPSPSVDAGAVEPADAISPPDEQGKVTLDLDALEPMDTSGAVQQPLYGDPEASGEEYELSFESLDKLKVVKAGAIKNPSDLKREFKMVAEAVKKFAAAGKLVRESKGYYDQISRMIPRVENMYEYLQESVSDSEGKEKYCTKLETLFQNIKKLQETAMSKKLKRLNEEDETQMADIDMGDSGVEDAEETGGEELTLKLTGLPDDVDLDDVGVDLIVGDEGADEEEDFGGDLEDATGEDDLGDLDLGGEEGDDVQLEGLSDDDVVEIDENMLRREIAKMAKLNEAEGQPSDELDANGHGAEDGIDDFGGASRKGEPLIDVDVCTDGAEPLGEADDDGEEPMEEMGEKEELPMESVQRRLAFEKRLQARSKKAAARLKVEAKKSSGKKLSVIREKYNKVVSRFNESLSRSKKISKQLNETANGSHSNSGTKTVAGKAVQTLRGKLAESKLHNVKLSIANKVLQMESLSKGQKAKVMKRLDECVNAREVKLVYKSVSDQVARKPRNQISESAVRGSSSEITRKGSTQVLNEGIETARWTKLAGITK